MARTAVPKSLPKPSLDGPARRAAKVGLAVAVLLLLAAPVEASTGWGSVTGTDGEITLRIADTSALGAFVGTESSNSVNTFYFTPAASGWGSCVDMSPPTSEPGGGVGGTCLCPVGFGLCPSTAPEDASTMTTGTDAAGNWVDTVHTKSDLRVEHRWHVVQSAGATDLVMVDVLLSNTGNSPMHHAIYRRSQSFTWSGVQPVDSMAMTVGSSLPEQTLDAFLIFSSANGLASTLPRDHFNQLPGMAGSCPAYKSGPGSASSGTFFTDEKPPFSGNCPSGAQAELDLGTIAPGGSAGFRMYYGVSPSESAALAAVGPSGMRSDLYFLGELPTQNGMASGAPMTFIWALDGLHRQNQGGNGGGSGGNRGNGGGNGNGNSGGGNGQSSPDRTDRDGDGIADGSDNCPTVYNPDQADRNHDGVGDPCDSSQNPPPQSSTDQAPPPKQATQDRDRDGIQDAQDNCPASANADQRDLDGDGLGDACDPDMDGDGIANAQDNCPATPNPNQADSDHDGHGDACSFIAARSPANHGAPGVANLQVASSTTSMQAAINVLLPLVLVASAVGGVVLARRRGAALFGIGLFTRIQRNELLDHPVRAQVMEAIEAAPGVNANELARRLGRPRSVISHHLRSLQRAGLVSRREAGGAVRHYATPPPAGPLPPAHPTAQRILRLVRESPGLSVGELADRASLGYGATHYHVRRLQAEGLLQVNHAGVLRVQPAAGHGVAAP
jgi:predicted transcriptional regulator